MAKLKFSDNMNNILLKNEHFISDEDLQILNEYIENSEITSFNSFMSEKFAKNLTFLQAIHELGKVCPSIETNTSRFTTKLTEGQQMQVVIDFFHSLNVDLGLKIEEIFSRNQSTYKVNLISDENDVRYGSNYVAEHAGDSKLDFTVTFDNRIESMLYLSHELAHATGSRVLEHFEVFNTAQQDESKYDNAVEYHELRKKVNIDCVAEVESAIIEKLFLEFILKLKIINKEQYNEFKNKDKNSFKHNLMLILNQCYAFSLLGENVTQESFKEFAHFCNEKQNNYVDLMNFIISKRKQGKTPLSAKPCFRYVVAEIVSTLWYNKFNQATIPEKRKMIRDFLKFHQGDTSIDITTAVSDLLGMTISEAGKEFYNLTIKENEQNYEF